MEPEINQHIETLARRIAELGRSTRDVATDIDIKPYVDAVNEASNRTRSILYALTIAVITIACAYRVTMEPDWLDDRLTQLQYASHCLERKEATEVCRDAIDYAEGFVFQFPDRYRTPDLMEEAKNHRPKEPSQSVRQLHEQITALQRSRADAMTVKLPLFGGTIDMNDIGLLSGLVLVAILFIFQAALLSEHRNLRLAKLKAIEHRKFEAIDLLYMAQVISVRSKEGMGTRATLYGILAAPVGLQSWLFYGDYQSREVCSLLETPLFCRAVITVEGILTFLVICFGVSCARKWSALLREINQLQEPVASEDATSLPTTPDTTLGDQLRQSIGEVAGEEKVDA